MFLLSHLAGFAEDLPVLYLHNGENEITLTLTNSGPSDLRSIRIVTDHAELPAWLSIDASPGVMDIPKGECSGKKLVVKVVVNGGEGDAAVVPFALSDAMGRSWAFRALVQVGSSIPAETALYENYPNPFNPSTNIRFSLKNKVHAKVVIYNTVGQVVRTLVDAPLNAGIHTVQWNGTDSRGLKVASGVYLCRFTAGRVHQTRKMMITE